MRLLFYLCSILLAFREVTLNTELPGPLLCGLENPPTEYVRPNYSIEYGDIAVLGQFPWTVTLIFEDQRDPHTYCSGFLINSRYVVTAARCFSNPISPNLRHLVLGDYDQSHDIDCVRDVCAPEPVIAEPEYFVVHENYLSYPDEYNIALIRLKTEIRFHDYLRPICLPSVIRNFQESSAEQELVTSGMGSTSSIGYISPSKILVFTKVVDHNICARNYTKINLNIDSSKQICTSSHSVCKYFDGAPFMKQVDDKNWVAEAIVSKTSVCDDKELPILGLKIKYFEDWIKNNLKP